MKTTKFEATICLLAALAMTACTDDDSSAESGMDSSTGAADDSDADDDGTPTTGGVADDGGETAGEGTMGSDGSTAADSGSDGADSGDSGSDGADSGDSGSDGEESGDSGDSGGSDEGGSTDDGSNVEQCEAPGDLISCDAWGDDVQWYQALGLGCEGGANEVIPVGGTGFNSLDATAWNLSTQFGSFEDGGSPIWSPREGEQFLVLSSGNAGTPDVDGVVLDAGGGSNGNPDDKPLPAPMSPQAGSGGAPFTGCDSVNDCSDSLITQWNAGGQGANDLIWMQFNTEVPAGTHGFAFDFAYFSEEFPEWVGTTFNDMFVVWSSSETYTGNLCFIDDQPCTVTALWPTQFSGTDAELADTSFTNDGGTGWFQIKGSAEPGEILQLTVAVFDMGDSILDTLVLLDNFAWDCEGCQPSEINPCGVVDPT